MNNYGLNSRVNNFENRGFSLVEMLVVIATFSILAILATQSLALTFKGSTKSESMISAQKDIRYALSVIERGLYNADEILSTCDSTWVNSFSYRDKDGNTITFSCESVSGIGFVALDSERITSEDTSITNCSFRCSMGTGNAPDRIDIQLTGSSIHATGIEGSQVSITNSVLLRSY